jgi:UDP-N-acetylglucosamine--N-acetylmuramyl-(pentapeptide) pyrophosphoryl-undecaprenol N-acetylglucosamine transferase
MALVSEGAALMVPDNETREKLVAKAFYLLEDDKFRKGLEEKIKLFAHPDSAGIIAREIEKIVDTEKK